MNLNTKISNKCPCNRINLLIFLIDILPIEDEHFKIKLINKYSDVEHILKLENDNIFKYIYFNCNIIHNIMYEYDTNITLNENLISSNNYYENLFYLDLLILSNIDIINYIFPKSFILTIINSSKIVNKTYIFSTILKTIILVLINNYKGSELYNEYEEEKELVEIEKQCKAEIQQNLKEIETFGIKFDKYDIFEIGIDNIYANIIKELIKNNRFSDYDFTCKIFDEIKLDKIYITKNIFDELKEVLSNEKEYIQPYLIKSIEDIFQISKINFYYILLKFIIRNSFYIFQIPLLLKTRNILKLIIKEDLDNLCYYRLIHEKNKEINDRVNYTINKMIDLDYFVIKYDEHYKLCKLKSIEFFYKFFFFEKYEKEINELKSVIRNKSKEKYNYFLYENITLLQNAEMRIDIINLFYELKITLGDFFLNQKKTGNILERWKSIEKVVKDSKYNKLNKGIRKNLYTLFKNPNIADTLKKIFTEKEIIACIEENSIFFKKSDSSSDSVSVSEKSISSNKESININFASKGEETSIIIESYTLNTNNIINKVGEGDKTDMSVSLFSVDTSLLNNKMLLTQFYVDKFLKSDYYKIMEHFDIIGRYENTKAEFFMELSNGDYISGGGDKYLFWYDKMFQQIKKIKMKDKQYHIYEIKNLDNSKDIIYFMSFSKNKISLTKLDLLVQKSYIECEIINHTLISVYYIDENKTLIWGLYTSYSFNNKFSQNSSKFIKFLDSEIFYKGAILLKNLTETILILTSNDILPHGANELIFYDCNKNKILGKISGYNFIPSYNSLKEIKQTIKIDEKMILCACYKKEKNKKINGILILNINLNKNKIEYKNIFYKTNNFEVYCFCQILIVDNNNPINDDITKTENINIIETIYILIGGYDTDKREGCIKLFKVYFKIGEGVMELKFVQDIIVEKNDKFKGFSNIISSITQSRITGNIVVTCWDGNIHLFRPPNMDFFLNKK